MVDETTAAIVKVVLGLQASVALLAKYSADRGSLDVDGYLEALDDFVAKSDLFEGEAAAFIARALRGEQASPRSLLTVIEGGKTE